MFMKLKYSNVPIWYIWYIRINSTDLIKSDYVEYVRKNSMWDQRKNY